MHYYTLRVSKDVCRSYRYFSEALCNVIAEKMQDYCQLFKVEDLSKMEMEVSVSPSDVNGSDKDATHNLFILRVGIKNKD